MKMNSLFNSKRLTILIILLLTLSFIGLASDKVLVAAADPWPPFADENSPTDGVALEIVRAAFETQGYEVTMLFVPWARAVNGVKVGDYDLVPTIWKNEERMEYMHYSDPFLQNSLKFIKRTEDPFEYEGFSSLDGKTVGIIRGYSYGQEFSSATSFKKDEANDFFTNVQKLLRDRIDLTVEDEIVAYSIIKDENPDFLSEITFLNPPLTVENLYITVGLAHPRHEEIINAFNKGLKIIKENGVYAEILSQYGIEPVE
jgi:polar amino acid transport system substrate-binding protein